MFRVRLERREQGSRTECNLGGIIMLSPDFFLYLLRTLIVMMRTIFLIYPWFYTQNGSWSNIENEFDFIHGLMYIFLDTDVK